MKVKTITDHVTDAILLVDIEERQATDSSQIILLGRALGKLLEACSLINKRDRLVAAKGENLALAVHVDDTPSAQLAEAPREEGGETSC